MYVCVCVCVFACISSVSAEQRGTGRAGDTWWLRYSLWELTLATYSLYFFRSNEQEAVENGLREV